MRAVLDKNYAQSPELNGYLSRGNRVVLTDTFFLETFKGNLSVSGIRRAFAGLEGHQESVDLMLLTPHLISLKRLEGNDFQERLIDPVQTFAFRDFLARLNRMSDLSEVGDIVDLKETHRFSKEFIDKARNEHLKELLAAMPYYRSIYSNQDIKMLLEHGKVRNSFMEKFLENTFSVALMVFEGKEIGPQPLKYSVNNYLFRYVLAGKVMALRWLIDGGWDARDPEKQQNDVVDMSYVAYGSYFDELLSLDKKQMEISRTTGLLLEMIKRNT